MEYERTYWEDSPGTATPVSAENLNNLEEGVVAAAEGLLETNFAIAAKADYTSVYKSKNLLNIPDTAASTTDGITVSVSDNIVTISGTATAAVSKSITLSSSVSIAAGTAHTLSVESTDDGEQTGQCTVYLYRSTGTSSADRISMYINGSTYPAAKTVTMDAAAEYVTLKISVASGKTVNQTIRLQLEEGSATDYVSPDVTVFGGKLTYDVNDLIDRTEQLEAESEELKKLKAANILYADSFGAVGDGKTDDTEAVEAAFAAAAETGQKLMFGSGKTYILSRTVVVENPFLNVDFNGCTVKASDNFNLSSSTSPSASALFKLNDNIETTESTSYNPNSEYTKFFRNVTLDGNLGKCPTALRIEHSTKGLFENINIVDFELFGIYIYGEYDSLTATVKSIGSENIFRNIHLTNSRVTRYLNSKSKAVVNAVNFPDYTTRTSTAIFATCSDCYFEGIVVIDWETAFENWGSDNYYTHCHIWAAFNENILNHTVGMLNCAGNIHMNGCCLDSLAYCVYICGSGRIWLSQTYTCWSDKFEEYEESQTQSSGGGFQPYVFYFAVADSDGNCTSAITGNTATKSTYLGAGVKIVNSNFKSSTITTVLADGSSATLNPSFTNLTSEQSKIQLDVKPTARFANEYYDYPYTKSEVDALLASTT